LREKEAINTQMRVETFSRERLRLYSAGASSRNMQMTSKAQEMPTPRRRLITFKEGLKHLHIGRTKAYELINTGKIIAYKQGHQTMIDADSIEAFQAALPRVEPGSLKPTRGRRPA
jgi:hypothetical protein